MRLIFVYILFGSFELNAQKKPNVFFLADDLGIGDVSCMNPATKIYSPNIDLLAKKGIKFKDAHSNSAVCTASRYVILSRWRFFKAGKRRVRFTENPIIYCLA
jgi:hypothetical protein